MEGVRGSIPLSPTPAWACAVCFGSPPKSASTLDSCHCACCRWMVFSVDRRAAPSGCRRAAALGVFGPVFAGELLLEGLGQQLPRELEGPMLFFVQMVAHLGGELLGEFAESRGRGIEPT